LTTYEPCPACQDAGGIIDECPICAGEGYIEEITSMDALAEFDDEEYPRT
jgi:DnaJ-class molecular chaperone